MPVVAPAADGNAVVLVGEERVEDGGDIITAAEQLALWLIMDMSL